MAVKWQQNDIVYFIFSLMIKLVRELDEIIILKIKSNLVDKIKILNLREQNDNNPKQNEYIYIYIIDINVAFVFKLSYVW